MRRALWCLVLVLSLVLPGLTLAQLPVMAPGTWFELPSSRPDGVAFSWPPGVDNGTNEFDVNVYSESSGLYDSLRRRFCMWGGGHNNYAGNEFLCFDLDTLTWSRLNDPCLVTDGDSSPGGADFLPTGYYPTVDGPGGVANLQCPRSIHSYNAVQYLPTIDRYCHFGLPAPFSQGGYVNTMDCFDPMSLQWEPKAPFVNDGTNHVVNSAVNPANGKAYALRCAGGTLREWDPATNAWTTRTGTFSQQCEHTALWDPVRSRYFFMGGFLNQALGTAYYVDLSVAGIQPFCDVNSTTGGNCGGLKLNGAGADDLNIQFDWRPGLTYDAALDVYVVYSGENRTGPLVYDFTTVNVWVIDPVTFKVARITPHASNTVTPPRLGAFANGESHIFTRFKYSPEHNIYLYTPCFTCSTYLYKIDPVAVATALGRIPPWTVSTLAEEQAKYDAWGWVWTASDKPDFRCAFMSESSGFPSCPTPYVVTDPDIHGTTESDDLFVALKDYQSTGQAGFLVRATEWARYFKDEYLACVGSSGRTYCADKAGFGSDHQWGWGLIEWYLHTCSTSCQSAYLDAAVAIGHDAKTAWTAFCPGGAGTCAPRDLTEFSLRQPGRALLFFTRLTDVTQWTSHADATEFAGVRDVLIELWSEATGWNESIPGCAGCGAYFNGQAQNDGSYGAGEHANGNRTMSALQVPEMVEGFWRAIVSTGNATLRERLRKIAAFVDTFALEPTYDIACRSFGVYISGPSVGQKICAETHPGTGFTVGQLDGTSTTGLVNTLQLRANLDSDGAYATRARFFWQQGMRFCSTSPFAPACPAGEVCHYSNKFSDGPSQHVHMACGKGEKHKVYQLFLPGAQPPGMVIPPPATQCNDTVDNADPEDVLIDMADPGCDSPADDDETDVVPPSECSDTIDNDGDTFIDLGDPGCANSADNDETDPAAPAVRPATMIRLRP